MNLLSSFNIYVVISATFKVFSNTFIMVSTNWNES